MESNMGVAGQQVDYFASSGATPYKRIWRSKGARKNQRYRKNQSAEKVQGQAYDPPRLKDLQKQNRLKTRKYYPKRRMTVPRTVPRAPFNDSSFLMRVRRSGGLATLVSPATSSFLTSPACSPFPCSQRVGANEPCCGYEDFGYGSMTGLIHLRPTEDDQSSGSTIDNDDHAMCVDQPSVCDADSVQQLEQRLDHDVSRFEMTYPLPEQNSVQLLEERTSSQDSYIAQLEDENMTLKERLFLMQQEVAELWQRQGSCQAGCSGEVDENGDAHSDHGGLPLSCSILRLPLMCLGWLPEDGKGWGSAHCGFVWL